jgi:O-acetylserine/cysteine efflux transporter
VPVRHVLLAVAVAVCWGVNFVVIDVGLDSFPPLLFAALRFVLTALPAALLVGSPGVPWRHVVALGLLTNTGQFALLFVAIDQGMPAGLASLVLQIQAVFTIGLAVGLLGERPAIGQLLGAACAIGGIGVIAAGRAEGVPLFALGLTVAAAAAWAAGNVVTRRARPPRPVALVVWSSVVAPVPLAALSLAFEGGAGAWADALGAVDASGLLALAYIVVLSTFFGYGAWAWLLGRHPASAVAPFTLLVPVVGIAAAWLALGERPTALELAGAAVVLLGLALATGAVRVPARGPRVPAGAGSAGSRGR